MRIGAKFNLVLLAVFVVGFAITALLSWTILQKNARQEVLDRASLMMEAALAMRSYTVGEIRPLLAPHMTDTFMPQTVPAYAATQTFETLRKSHAEYTYKEATLNPTNPRDRATGWEADIVETFRNFADRKEIIGQRDTGAGARSMYLARPIRITNEGCLGCHSQPAVAPKSMIDLYGTANGFGWQMNEVVGAQIVSVPMSVPEQHARDAFMVFMGTLAGVFLMIFIAINLMLRSIVVSPITRIANLADEVSKGNLRAADFPAGGKDEIATLGMAFTRMRRSLEKALKMLQG